ARQTVTDARKSAKRPIRRKNNSNPMRGFCASLLIPARWETATVVEVADPVSRGISWGGSSPIGVTNPATGVTRRLVGRERAVLLHFSRSQTTPPPAAGPLPLTIARAVNHKGP